ncbi:SRPBCC family protein [Acinetobacter oleivorans]|uniref:SRPBCC family protein n=1 Tax=Acinetobacter oleivorans TaxID=1148157 RepID=UPI0018FF2CD0|nr:SRPBCC domain-containing protein [Acinetobacter oleivorans]MBJ8499533.1 SRPBCC domain-containing protein [Acinetobacter oleivorans]
MLESIDISQFINQSPQKVWEALTKPELVQQWWAKGGIQPKIGHQFTLDMGNFGIQHCLVKAVDKEILVEYDFAIGVLDTTLRWQLIPQENGTLLQLNHSGFNIGSSFGQQAFIGMGKGWTQILSRVEAVISNNK